MKKIRGLIGSIVKCISSSKKSKIAMYVLMGTIMFLGTTSNVNAIGEIGEAPVNKGVQALQEIANYGGLFGCACAFVMVMIKKVKEAGVLIVCIAIGWAGLQAIAQIWSFLSS